MTAVRLEMDIADVEFLRFSLYVCPELDCPECAEGRQVAAYLDLIIAQAQRVQTEPLPFSARHR